jgi:iron(II)-dependent oxidoreductase
MSRHELLGQLSGLHQMMRHLFESIPEADCYTSYNPSLPSLAWLFGRAVYLESYWIREVVQEDNDITHRVHHLFAHDVDPSQINVNDLPSREHLLNWALPLQDHHLMLLANPTQLPPHPLIENEQLLRLVLQQQAIICEQMLMQLSERRLTLGEPHLALNPIHELQPSTNHEDLHQGHYRIGAKDDPAALDNELPPNVVELSSFRMDKMPVTNGAFLSFINANGYRDRTLWSDIGWEWLQRMDKHPNHWRQDGARHWYGIGLNGPYDLIAEDYVYGISYFEAQAYANWVATLGGIYEGAIVQHEYQWEVAARSKAITSFKRVYEWCANLFHPYSGYQTPEYIEAISTGMDESEYSVRGYSIHSQPIQQRSSFRTHAKPGSRYNFCGTRLVFPPSKMAWHK